MSRPNLVFHFFIHFIADKKLLVTWLDLVIYDDEALTARNDVTSYIDYCRVCIKSSIENNFIDMPVSNFLYSTRNKHRNKIRLIADWWSEFDGHKLILQAINEQA